MALVGMVVKNGKTVRVNGKAYTAGEIFLATPKQARLWAALGRAQVDLAGDGNFVPVRDMPKPKPSELTDVMKENAGKRKRGRKARNFSTTPSFSYGE